VRGNPIKARLLMVSLKAFASSCLKASLFLSKGERMRLKSPRMIHGVRGRWLDRL
jgi:hypothetical protein